MKRSINQCLKTGLATSLLMGSSLLFWDCSGEKKESSSATTDTTSDVSGPMGRQVDTENAPDPMAPQQAPPDSASARGRTVVPAEVNVKVKQ